jgi:hypothetical protein
MARLKKERKANLKKEKEKSYKVTLNVSIVANRGIILRIATRNRNKTEEPGRKSKSQIKNGSLNRKSISEESKMRPEKIQRKR